MTRPSRVLVNTVALTAPLTGIGRYTLEVCRRLENDRDLDLTFFYGYFSRHLADEKKQDKVLETMRGTRILLASFPAIKRMGRMGLMALACLDRSHHDIYWEPNLVPLPQLIKKADRTVATLHDFSWYHHPEWHPGERLELFKRYFFKGVERCNHLITGSEYTRNEIMEIMGVPGEKITVIHHGVDHERFKEYPQQQCRVFAKKAGLPEKFILFVGTLEPRKNLEGLLKAYEVLPDPLKREYRLVIAGGKGWKDEGLRNALHGMEKDVHLTGYTPDHELPLLYNLASVFVYPSLYEGFGIPPIEAMACGCPVVVSNVTAMPEVCGNAAIYCNTLDPEDIRNKIEAILEDKTLRNDMAKRGIEKARTYTWERSAKTHSEVLLRL
jgi:glycosyltransferase involved in cell wall biosynthesis